MRKRHRRQLDRRAEIRRRNRLAHPLQFGHVGVVEVRHVRNRAGRLDHLRGDGAANPRHRLAAHVAVGVFAQLARRHGRLAASALGGNSAGRRLRLLLSPRGFRFANSRLRLRRRHHRFRLSSFLRLGFHLQHSLANLDVLPLGHLNLGDLAGVGTRDFQDRLVGLQFDDAVVGGDHVPFADQHADHIAAG